METKFPTFTLFPTFALLSINEHCAIINHLR